MDDVLICDQPTPACFRGECLLCQLGMWVSVEKVAWAAEALGMSMDFIRGRVNGFPGTQIRYRV